MSTSFHTVMNPHMKKRMVMIANGPRFVRPVVALTESEVAVVRVMAAIFFKSQSAFFARLKANR
jgi:hypothetical protein